MCSSFDRLTELQNQLDFLSQMFYTSIGVIQRDSIPAPLSHFPENAEQKELHSNFRTVILDMAQQISRTARIINVIIESLPEGINSNEIQQLQTLVSLEEQNRLVANQLRDKVHKAELELESIRKTLKIIIEDSVEPISLKSSNSNQT